MKTRQIATPTRPDGTVRVDARRASPPARTTVAASWISMRWSMRILRAFLGVTFLYAGIQKFLDRGFFHRGSATFIGKQLSGFAQGTPAGPLMRLLERMPVVTGVGVATVEIAVGLATLLGVGLLLAAFVGCAVSVTLWLSATWHVHPYFLGSDSIYAVAWLTLLIGAWDLEPTKSRDSARTVARPAGAIDRRAVLRGGMVAAFTLALAATARSLAGPLSKRSPGLGASPAQGSGRADAAGGGSGVVAGPASPTSPPPVSHGTTIGNLAQLSPGQAIAFTAPGVGPAALVRLADGRVVAYSRICTHAGCSVGYDSRAGLLVCPCHGAEFDPAHHAQPVAGPAPSPLRPIHVVVDQATGDIVLPP